MSEPEDTQAAVGRDPRVYLAAERTLLAWIRTGLALMGFGFVVARFAFFLREFALAQGVTTPGSKLHLSLWVGVAMVMLGIAVNLGAAWRHARFSAQFFSNQPVTYGRGRFGVALGFVLAVLGVALCIYLLTLNIL